MCYLEKMPHVVASPPRSNPDSLISIRYTATCCSTLPSAATHCNTPQHVATTREKDATCRRITPALKPRCLDLDQVYCNTLQHTAACCNTLQHAAAQYNTLQQRTRKMPCVIVTLPYSKVDSFISLGYAQGCTCCSVLQYVAMCCSVLQGVAFISIIYAQVCTGKLDATRCNTLQHTATTRERVLDP